MGKVLWNENLGTYAVGSWLMAMMLHEEWSDHSGTSVPSRGREPLLSKAVSQHQLAGQWEKPHPQSRDVEHNILDVMTSPISNVIMSGT